MKKLIFTAILCIVVATGFSQTNFKWDKSDSIAKNSSQLYIDTKMFIAENWKSSKSVIQNDDKDAGVVLIKGSSIKEVPYMMGVYTYIYNYTITFKIKDSKYKVIVDNVYCNSAYYSPGAKAVKKIEPFDGDNCPSTGDITAAGIPKKKAIIMMAEFKQELQSIIDSYEKHIKTSSGW